MRKLIVGPATKDDLGRIKELVDAERDVFGFQPRSVYAESIERSGLLVARLDSHAVVGFVRFRLKQSDNTCTLYDLCVAPELRRKGIGTLLVDELKLLARKAGKERICLKCPTGSPANSFYRKLGFISQGSVEGRRRRLNLWSLPLDRPRFVCALPTESWEIRKVVELLDRARLDEQFPMKANPLSSCLLTPLNIDNSVLELVRSLKEEGIIHEVIFDSGGYHVQRGTISYLELCEFLPSLYMKHSWADHFVLPDHPPSNGIGPTEMQHRVKETVEGSMRVFEQLHWEIQARAFPVVQGLTEEQIQYCVDRYQAMGFARVGFGSFKTRGTRSAVNYLEARSVRLLKSLRALFPGHIHVFGIGSPPGLWAMAKLGANSVDSSGWMKSAGYGNVYLPYTRAFNVSYMKLTQTPILPAEFLRLKSLTRHDCPMCRDFYALSRSRYYRMVHNLICAQETLMCNAGDEVIAEILDTYSPYYKRLVNAN